LFLKEAEKYIAKSATKMKLANYFKPGPADGAGLEEVVIN
jgi:hypothetical protein